MCDLGRCIWAPPRAAKSDSSGFDPPLLVTPSRPQVQHSHSARSSPMKGTSPEHPEGNASLPRPMSRFRVVTGAGQAQAGF